MANGQTLGKDTLLENAIMNINDMSEEEQLAAVQKDGMAIYYIDDPSENVQLAAVQQNGYAIRFIKNPSRFIKNPSENVQLAAVQQNPDAIKYIKNPSERVQLAAVQQDGHAIAYIDNPSERVQLAAVQKNPEAIRYIRNPSDRVKRASRGEPVETDKHEYDSMPTFEESFDSVINNIINEAFGEQCPECSATLGMKDGEPCSECKSRPAPICHECGWPIYGSSNSHDYDDSHLDTDCPKCGRPGCQLSCERNRGTPDLYRHPRA